jgi:type I restriction enzyme S subunit
MRIAISIIKKFEFELPLLQTQKRIADILSTYDDLIENNLKRIKLLEQAAQNIYKEWFVNLRFPGYENAVLDTETRLPGGWEEVLMEDIMNVSGGGTPSTKESLYWEEGKVLWFSPTDLNKNNSLVLIDSTKKITELGLKKSSAKLLPQRTILMSSRATIGLFGLFNGDCSTNQGFININPKEESLRYYILFNLKSRVEELIANASGATFKELSKRVFKRMSIVSPNASISTNFYDQVEFFINQTENLEFQNQKLKAARDILLPRLMNRTIKV